MDQDEQPFSSVKKRNDSNTENDYKKNSLSLTSVRDDGFDTENGPSSASEAFSLLLESVGSGGAWQWRLFLLTAFSGVFTSLHNLGAVFLAGEPEHWCAINELEVHGNISKHFDLRNHSIPWIESSRRYARCHYYARDYGSVMHNLTSGSAISAVTPKTLLATCQRWRFDRSVYTETVVSEWNLVCSNRWLMSSVQSSYMIGFMAGALLISQLADKYGRRTMLLVSAAGFSASTMVTRFSYSYFMFLCSRFFVAAFGSGIYLSNFVILMESLGNEHRTKYGVFFQAGFNVGICVLALLGYVFRDWRNLQFAISAPNIILVITYYFYVPESPRWLVMEGRQEEATEILRKIAVVNKGVIPTHEKVTMYMKFFNDEKTEEESCMKKCSSFGHDIYSLIATKNMRRRCLTLAFIWFTASMIYYGLTFNGNNLRLPLYLMLFVSGLLELLALPFNVWILNTLGRRNVVISSMIGGGLFCLAIMFIPSDRKWLNLVMATTGKLFISTGFTTVFMYTAELVPTRVRSMAVGMSSMWARVGSFLAPYIVDLLGDIHYSIPSTVFGLFALASGLLSVLLPETTNKNLPETIEEIEAAKK